MSNASFSFIQDTTQETRKEFIAPIEWQYEKSQEFSELRERVRKEKDNFITNHGNLKNKFVSLSK